MFYLSSHTYQDLDFIHRMLASPAMMKYIVNGTTKTLRETQAFLQWIYRHYQENGQLGLKIIEHSQTKARLGHAVRSGKTYK